MKKNKLIDIIKISILPFLIYMKLFFISLELKNNYIFNLVSNIFLIISLLIILIITLRKDPLKKILTKYKKELIAMILFTLYFLYSDIIISLILTIFKINPNNINLLTEQLIYIFSTLIFIIILVLTYRKELIDSFKEIKTKFRSYLEIGIPIYIFGLICMVVINFILIFVFKLEGAKNETGIRETLKLMPIYTMFSASIGAPIIEEMIFRKTFKDIFKNPSFYIFMSGFIFGLLHVIGSYTTISDLLYIFPYGALGVSFAYMYYKTKNIFVPISFHFIHNTTLLILQLMVMK